MAVMSALMNGWRARPQAEQRRLLGAGLIILLLLGYLAVRQLASLSARQHEWLTLAQRSEQLSITQSLDNGQWQRLAQQHRLQLQDIAAQEGGWRVSGQVAQAQQLERFLADALQLGWYPQGWQLQAAALADQDGLAFSLQLMALTPLQGE